MRKSMVVWVNWGAVSSKIYLNIHLDFTVNPRAMKICNKLQNCIDVNRACKFGYILLELSFTSCRKFSDFRKF